MATAALVVKSTGLDIVGGVGLLVLNNSNKEPARTMIKYGSGSCKNNVKLSVSCNATAAARLCGSTFMLHSGRVRR